jgi:hypothetical protein
MDANMDVLRIMVGGRLGFLTPMGLIAGRQLD